MKPAINVSRLSRHRRYYIAGYRRGALMAAKEAKEVAREFFEKDVRELIELRASYSLLATRYHKLLLDRAVETAVAERESEENRFRPLH